MEGDRLREWVEKKLEQGVSEDRIKKSLRNTGHDPSIVDEVQDPFEQDQDSVEDISSSPEDSGLSQEEHDSDLELVDRGDEQFQDDSSTRDSDAGSSLDLAMPDFPALPGVSTRGAAIVVGVLVALGGYFLVPAGAMPDLSSDFSLPELEVPEVSIPDVKMPSSTDNSDQPGGSSTTDAGCDVGVRINSASVSNGRTSANVVVTRGTTDVVLEVRQDSATVDSGSARIGGEGVMVVDAVGDRVVLHPEGCSEPRDSAPVS